MGMQSSQRVERRWCPVKMMRLWRRDRGYLHERASGKTSRVFAVGIGDGLVLMHMRVDCACGGAL